MIKDILKYTPCDSLPKLITHLKKLDFHFIFLDYIGLIVYIQRRKSDTRYYIIGLSIIQNE